MEGRSFNAGN